MIAPFKGASLEYGLMAARVVNFALFAISFWVLYALFAKVFSERPGNVVLALLIFVLLPSLSIARSGFTNDGLLFLAASVFFAAAFRLLTKETDISSDVKPALLLIFTLFISLLIDETGFVLAVTFPFFVNLLP